jgi:hypothetical protein
MTPVGLALLVGGAARTVSDLVFFCRSGALAATIRCYTLVNFLVLVRFSVLRSVSNPTSFAPLPRTNDMKQILAACVAIAVLWVIDVEFNNGRYSQVVQRTFKYILAK